MDEFVFDWWILLKNVITCVENFNAFGSILKHFVEIWTSRYIQIKRSQQMDL
jgi:hypothetical protein